MSKYDPLAPPTTGTSPSQEAWKQTTGQQRAGSPTLGDAIGKAIGSLARLLFGRSGAVPAPHPPAKPKPAAPKLTEHKTSELEPDNRRFRYEAIRRVSDINALPAPATVGEFLGRASETVADLRRLALAYPGIVTAVDRRWLDEIDQAIRHLTDGWEQRSSEDDRMEFSGGGGGGDWVGGGSGGGGGGGSGGGDGGGSGEGGGGGDGEEEGFWRRFMEAMRMLATRLGEVSASIASSIAEAARRVGPYVKDGLESLLDGAVGR